MQHPHITTPHAVSIVTTSDVRVYRVSRSKRNLGAAADGWEVPQLTARSHQGEVFYQEVER